MPFVPDNYGFYIKKDDVYTAVELQEMQGTFNGALDGLVFGMNYEVCEEHLKLNVRIENKGEDFEGWIGFHMGVDTYMERYPEWHDKFFPTLLRCEKTHLWRYYMNSAENALAVATAGPVASYDIQYNMMGNTVHCGHRIPGTDVVFTKIPCCPRDILRI